MRYAQCEHTHTQSREHKSHFIDDFGTWQSEIHTRAPKLNMFDAKIDLFIVRAAAAEAVQGQGH